MVTKTTSLVFLCCVICISEGINRAEKLRFVRFVQVRTLVKTDLRTGTKAKFLTKDEALIE